MVDIDIIKNMPEPQAPNEPTASSIGAESNLSQSERQTQLVRIGFNPLGNSGIYQYEEFLAKPSAHNFTFYDSFEGVPDVEISGVRIGNSYGTECLEYIVTYPDGRQFPIQRTLNGSGGAFSRGEEPSIEEFPKGSIEEQLQQSGFVEDENTKGLYKRLLAGQEVLAVVENGTLVEILKPARPLPKVIEKLGFNIDGVGEDLSHIRSKPTLLCSNDAMKFEIDSFGYVKTTELLREIMDEELGITKIEEQERDGFKIGGVNSTEVIKGLKSLNGIPIDELEQVMRPGKSSIGGFLGKNESLSDTLAQDNDFVLQHGLTHQELAYVLRYAEAIQLELGVSEFSIKGGKYKVDVARYRGIQDSPFRDGTVTNADLEITNITTGKSLRCSGLLADLIERYGFYEGPDSPYRLSPQNIIEVFDFLQKSSSATTPPAVPTI